MCFKRGESVQHIISECEKLAQKENKRCHDNVAKRIHSELCRRHSLECKKILYDYNPDGIAENNDLKFLWDTNIQCDHVVEARRPDIIITDKRRQSGIIVDMAVPADGRVHEKERDKVAKYLGLRGELEDCGN